MRPCPRKKTDGSGHTAVERTAAAARDRGNVTPSRERKSHTAGTEPDHDVDQHARSALRRAGRSSRHTGDRQARPVRRRSDEVHGLVVQAEIVLRGRESAVSAGADDDRSIVDPETQRDAQQRRKCPQDTVVLHTRDDNGMDQHWTSARTPA